jgi:hypothetical protein
MCDDSNNDGEASSAVIQERKYQNFKTPEKGLVDAEIMRRIGVMHGHFG